MRQSRPIGLLISFIIFYHLPNFTYLEAEKIIIKETKIDLSKENEIKGLYTIESVYINSEDGKYSKRKNLNE